MCRTDGVTQAASVRPAASPAARLLALLFPAGCLCFSILLGLPGAIDAPDSAQYRLLALGQRVAVPAPFSARILGPAIAGWLGRVTGLGVDKGFLVLGILCLAALIGLISGYLWSWRAPIVLFAAVFLMPFWVDMFHDYYLPDLLHGVLLAAMLVCLLHGYTSLGLLLLFPAFLARESTILVAFCLLAAGWRRIPRQPAVVGVIAGVGGWLASAHWGQGGAASVHGVSGGVYLLGKLLWSFFRNVLGLPLWSNTLPECAPIWVYRLPHGAHLGAIGTVGLCQPSLWGPGRLLLAWFGVFGLGPALALALRRTMFLPSALAGKLWQGRESSGTGAILVFRFAIIYGLISILLTPLLGASADRLAAYAWPFYFVALPWFLARFYSLDGPAIAGFVCLHLAICWLAWFSFQQDTTGYVFGGLGVLILNGVGYVIARRYQMGT